MRSYILLVSILLNGCGSDFIEDHVKLPESGISYRSPRIENEFLPHVDKFNETYSTDVHMLIEFGELDEKTMGVCYSWSDGHREIKIDSVKWPRLSKEGQEQLLFHELGHCLFDLDHDEGLVDMGTWVSIPKSIMYPYVFGNMSYYTEFKEYYHNQLGNM